MAPSMRSMLNRRSIHSSLSSVSFGRIVGGLASTSDAVDDHPFSSATGWSSAIGGGRSADAAASDGSVVGEGFESEEEDEVGGCREEEVFFDLDLRPIFLVRRAAMGGV